MLSITHALTSGTATSAAEPATSTRVMGLLRRIPWGSAYLWIGVTIGLGIAVRVPLLGGPLFEPYEFRQAQTAFAIQGYLRDGINLAHSPLPIFGVAKDVPFEFPLFQAIASLVARTGLGVVTAGELTALCAFQAVVLLWSLLLLRWQYRWAVVGVAFLLEMLPFGIVWGTAVLIDFFSLALGLAMVLALDTWVRRGSLPWLALGAVMAWLAFLVKITTVPSIGILLLVAFALSRHLLVDLRRWTTRVLVALATGPLVGAGLFFGWTRHADAIKATSPLTERFVSTAPLVRTATTGTLSERFGSGWQPMTTVLSETTLTWGPWLLLASVVVVLVWGTPQRRLVGLGLLVAVLAPVLIFFPLYVAHGYYQIAIYPMVVTVPVVAIDVLLQRETWPRTALALALGFLLAGAPARLTYETHLDWLWHRPQISSLATHLRAVTAPGDKVLVVGCSWDPQHLFNADRTGLMAWDYQPPSVLWRDNDVRDYAAVARCNADVDPNTYLPAGAHAVPTKEPDVFLIKHAR